LTLLVRRTDCSRPVDFLPRIFAEEAAHRRKVILFLLLVTLYLILTLAGRWIGSFEIAPARRARVGLALFFVFTAIEHFVRTEEMSAMILSSIPFRTEPIYITGALELLGAVGVWIPGLVRLTGICLILMLLCLLPANIYGSGANKISTTIYSSLADSCSTISCIVREFLHQNR
jgi:uncharacterized membrane protein